MKKPPPTLCLLRDAFANGWKIFECLKIHSIFALSPFFAKRVAELRGVHVQVEQKVQVSQRECLENYMCAVGHICAG
jgi:hypothetical protein